MKNIKVVLWGKKVGYISEIESSRKIIFKYDNEFIKQGLEISPLRLPLSTKIYDFSFMNGKTFQMLPGVFSDSVPDDYGDMVISKWNRFTKTASFSIIDKLAYIGSRGMGALEYVPNFNVTASAKKIEINDLEAISTMILDDKEIKSSVNLDFEELISVSSSAGGKKSKAVVAYNRDTNSFLSGNLPLQDGFEHYILKFDEYNSQNHKAPISGNIEYAYYKMALDCGVNMQNSLLIENNDKFHFLTKRFDRDGDKKIHTQTFNGFTHLDFREKHICSYELVFDIMEKLNFSYRDREQFYRRMCFNEILVNYDDHTKNISFIMDKKGKWTLSPNYDVTYNYDYVQNYHEMLINGKVRDITYLDLLEVAKKKGIKRAKLIIETIVDTASKWEKFATDAKVKKYHIKAIKKRLELDKFRYS